jgi:MFS family permease
VTPRTLLRASRIAVVCIVLAGMVTGAFWVLGPVVGREYGLDSGEVGLMVSLSVLGGALSQYPVGLLSDRMDRRQVIAILSVCGIAVAILGYLFAGSGTVGLLASMASLCACAMPLYAVCIALAAERTDLTLVEVTGGMLLANGLGSIVGPVFMAPAMTGYGPRMFFLACAICMAAAAVWAMYRFIRSDRPGELETHRPMLPRTTQAVAELVRPESGSK